MAEIYYQDENSFWYRDYVPLNLLRLRTEGIMTDCFVPAQGEPYYVNDSLFCADKLDRVKQFLADNPSCASMVSTYMEELHSFVLRSTKNYSTEITEDFAANLSQFTSLSQSATQLEPERVKKVR